MEVRYTLFRASFSDLSLRGKISEEKQPDNTRFHVHGHGLHMTVWFRLQKRDLKEK